MKTATLLLLTVAALTFWPGQPIRADAPPRYRLTVLPLIFSGYSVVDEDNGQCAGVNNNGQVVGAAVVHQGNPYDRRAAFWQQGHLRLLDTTPVKSIGDADNQEATNAAALNARGDVVGTDTDSFSGGYSGRGSSALHWHGHKSTYLDAGPDTDSAAFGINDHGDVVGGLCRHYDFNLASTSEPPTPPSFFTPHAFLWHQGRIRMLWAGVARGINNRGEIVGVGKTGILWRSGYTIPLKMQPVAINNAGEIAGSFPLTKARGNDRNIVDLDDGRACVWRRGRVTLLSKQISRAYALNNSAHVVGEVGRGASWNPTRATLWRDGRAYDLNRCAPLPRGWVLTAALGINDMGWIIGEGSVYKSPKDKQAAKSFTFLLTPR